MKNSFSKNWNKSVQPRKQRKYLANAPLHVRHNIMKSNLSKDLRAKYGVRSMVARKGDKVLIMRGAFKKVEAKVEKVDRKKYKLIVEGVKMERKDGTKVSYPVHYSKVQIIDLDLSDKRRIKEKVK